MNENRDEELLLAVDYTQWALGESMLQVKKLKSLVDNNNKTNFIFDRDLNELILALYKITNLYRHNIADILKSILQ